MAGFLRYCFCLPPLPKEPTITKTIQIFQAFVKRKYYRHEFHIASATTSRVLTAINIPKGLATSHEVITPGGSPLNVLFEALRFQLILIAALLASGRHDPCGVCLVLFMLESVYASSHKASRTESVTPTRNDELNSPFRLPCGNNHRLLLGV